MNDRYRRAALSSWLFFLTAGNALAYIDPGTGSFLFQILISGIIGVLFGLKVFWKKIRLFFSRKK